MEQIHVTLPDGSVKDVPKGTTPIDIAKSISPRLADAALVAKVSAMGGNGGTGKDRHFLQLRGSRGRRQPAFRSAPTARAGRQTADSH